MVPSPISRRSFLKRSGLVAGVSLAGAFGGGPATPARRSHDDLSAGRERTYAALVGAVAAAQGARASPRHIRRASDNFRSWYRASLPHVRAGIDAILDDLEAQPGGFARLDRDHRVRVLQTSRARSTVAHAVVLASPPLAFDADDAMRASAAAV